MTTHDPADWSRNGGLPTTELRKDGFIAGIREDLRSLRTESNGVSMAAQFKTAAGAARAAAQAVPSGTTFAVPGIRGARGFTFYRGSDDTRQYFISFADGNFGYLVGLARPAERSLPHTDALIAAATFLDRRIAGHPAP